MSDKKGKTINNIKKVKQIIINRKSDIFDAINSEPSEPFEIIKMKKNVNYSILPEYKLILECCKGNATVEEAISMKKDELADNFYNSKYNVIVDFRDFTSFVDASSVESVSVFFDFLTKINAKNRVAFLTYSPNQVVISKILKDLCHDALTIEIFSIVENAIAFLGYLGDELDEIEDKIFELNKNTA
jgi:hypothetical protein